MPFDFAAVTAPFRMQPGLRRLGPDAVHLTPHGPGDRSFDEKLHVLRQWPLDAMVAAAGFDARPALDALGGLAAREHPRAWRTARDGAGEALRLGWRVDGERVEGDGPTAIGAALRALPPQWRLPGLLSLAFVEDFAVIDGATAHIPWIAACLPSHWAPADKVGRHFAEVHAPVADNQLLLAAADRLARLVTGVDRWERFVWTVTPCPTLQMHPRHAGHWAWPEGGDADRLAALAHLRTERQTFLPLPEAQQAVFTIGVESRPLAEALTTPEQARALHDAIASMSPAVLAYRALGPARERLLQWLSARAGPMDA